MPLSSPASAQLGKEEIDPTLYDLTESRCCAVPRAPCTARAPWAARQTGAEPAAARHLRGLGEVISDTTSGGSINHQINGMVNLPFGDSVALRIVGTDNSRQRLDTASVIADGAVAVDSGSFHATTYGRPISTRRRFRSRSTARTRRPSIRCACRCCGSRWRTCRSRRC